MATLKNGLSRRSFLTLGGVAALGGAAALAGCAPQASSSANADAKGATDDAASAMQTADQTKECDIAIVGAGGAGMWAAVEAVRAGKSVVVIEKSSWKARGASSCSTRRASASSWKTAHARVCSARATA